MSLTALHLARFKAFGDSQRIPIRPLTLIFGANSAGKSSIIHALALAHHALETGDLDVQRTQIGGESIDLGGFRQYVHRHEREKRVDLVVELDPARLEGRVAQLLHAARHVALEVSIGTGFTSEQRTLFGDLSREVDRERTVRVESFALRADGSDLLTMSARRDGQLRLDRLEHEHPVMRGILTGLLAYRTTTEVRDEDFAAAAEAIDELVPAMSAYAPGLFPRLKDLESGDGERGETEFVAVSREKRSADLRRAAREFFPRTFCQLVNGMADAAAGEIRKLQYLGPLRSYPPRRLAFSQHHDPNWFAGGGYAWDVVRQRKDVRDRINQWLGSDRLKTPYELIVRDLVALDQLATPVSDAIGDLEVDGLEIGFDEERDVDGGVLQSNPHPFIVDPDGEVSRFVAAINNSDVDRVTELILHDLRSRTVISHRDVGIGVSQVLPVLVAAYASTNRLVAIEQPEIHLHPALQAELGDVFLESALGESRNVFLLETHSEHLILRILRRIRETTEGELPEGMKGVTPQDVAVLYVQPNQAGSEVLHIPVTADGEFERPWPEGFFAERAKELF